MPTYKSNAKPILIRLIKALKTEDDLRKRIADVIYQNIQNRVFGAGKDVNGTNIGNYANSTIKIRERHGLQTSTVDLVFSGGLMASFKVSKYGTSYTIGFSTQKAADIAGYNEDHFDKTIFGLSESDYTEINNLITDWTNKLNI